MKFKDITGHKFGQLLAVRVDGKTTSGNYMYLCYCDCGESIVVNGTLLRTGKKLHCNSETHKTPIYTYLKKENIFNGFGTGYTQQNKEFLFDLDDYDKLSKYSWSFDDQNMLISVIIKKTPDEQYTHNLYAWRLILIDYNMSHKVHFKNGNTFDLRKDNLEVY